MIEIRESAESDLDAGCEFYAKQGEGLAGYFLDSLLSDIDSLALYAGSHRRVGQYFRCKASRFPFEIYYTVEGELICVWAVIDTRQNPEWIKKQLNRRK